MEIQWSHGRGEGVEVGRHMFRHHPLEKREAGAVTTEAEHIGHVECIH